MILILMNFKRISATLASLSLGVGLIGCGSPAEGGVTVAAAFYPLEYAVESVAGDGVTVTPLTTPGVEAHDVELTPRQVAAVVDADLVVYLAGFQPAVDEAVKQADPAKVLDVGQFAELREEGEDDDGDHTGHDHGNLDPHFWLDPMRLADVTDAIADELAAVDPEQATTLSKNAAATRSDLTALDEEFMTGLQTCERRELFTSHSAFGYLAERYDLEQISVVGISPNVEPSGTRIAEVQKLARQYDATTIFFETTASDAVAVSIAQDLGLDTAVLDPIESVTDQSAGQDYPSIMRSNLAAIEKANDCG